MSSSCQDPFVDELDRKVAYIEAVAKRMRWWVVRSIYEAGSGHPGGSLSATDILATLYFHVLNHDPRRPQWPDRDRFVLSKGHAAPALYAALALAGYFPEEDLLTLRKLGSYLQGHPDMRKTPGVDMSTGSLGQGLSVGIGMALAARLDRRTYNVYVLLGDGECQEGQVWEAAMAAAHYRLDNLTAIVDRNMLQIDGPTEQVMPLEPLAFKWKAFGWHTIECNGHDVRALMGAFERALEVQGQPTVVLAHTVKGKGVSLMEGRVGFHGRPPDEAEYAKAMQELGGAAPPPIPERQAPTGAV